MQHSTRTVIGAFAVAYGLTGGVAAWAGNAKVCFEGEAAISKVKPLRLGADKVRRKGFAGKGYIEIPWDRNLTKGIGQAVYHVKAPVAGVYYLWARTFWANGCGNSILVQVNNASPKILGQDGTYEKWHWIGGSARVNLKKGINTLVLHNRETGIAVDQFFLSQDPEYIPVGTRPDTQ